LLVLSGPGKEECLYILSELILITLTAQPKRFTGFWGLKSGYSKVKLSLDKRILLLNQQLATGTENGETGTENGESAIANLVVVNNAAVSNLKTVQIMRVSQSC
jgi:hypothetical protein